MGHLTSFLSLFIILSSHFAIAQFGFGSNGSQPCLPEGYSLFIDEYPRCIGDAFSVKVRYPDGSTRNAQINTVMGNVDGNSVGFNRVVIAGYGDFHLSASAHITYSCPGGQSGQGSLTKSFSFKVTPQNVLDFTVRQKPEFVCSGQELMVEYTSPDEDFEARDLEFEVENAEVVNTSGRFLRLRSLNEKDIRIAASPKYRCGQTVTTNVKVNSGTLPIKVLGDDSICFYSETIMEAEKNDLTAYAYRWYFQGEELVAHRNQQLISVANPGTYKLKACPNSSDLSSVTIRPNTEEGACTNVSGSLSQGNSTCHPVNDAHLRNRIILLEPGNFYGITDGQGKFSMRVPEGNYHASLIKDPEKETICFEPVVDVPHEDEVQIVIDRYITEDIEVSIAAGVPRPGFSFNYVLQVTNTGAAAHSGTLLFFPDEILSNVSEINSSDGIDDDRVEIPVISIQPGESNRYTYEGVLPPDVELLGQEVTGTILYTNDNGDIAINAADSLREEIMDRRVLQETIVGSYDPNDIAVHPGPETHVEELWLDYKIRFQNTGSYFAENVIIRDTLPAELDLRSLKLGIASHDYKVSIQPMNVLEWRFEGIKLPQSSLDEPRSHGFVTFRIKRDADLPLGYQFSNKAEIYFDFNPPIITNDANTKIVDEVSDYLSHTSPDAEILVFPNPATSRVQIFASHSIRSIAIMDANGIEIMSGPGGGSRSQEIEVAEFNSGIYAVRLQLENGQAVLGKFMKISH